jgi:hypothetical protein
LLENCLFGSGIQYPKLKHHAMLNVSATLHSLWHSSSYGNFFKKISLTKIMLFTPFWFQKLKILDSKMSVNILRIVPETIYTLVKYCKISHSTVIKRLCILIVLHLKIFLDLQRIWMKHKQRKTSQNTCLFFQILLIAKFTSC